MQRNGVPARGQQNVDHQGAHACVTPMADPRPPEELVQVLVHRGLPMSKPGAAEGARQ
jgi:hypothetical protein